MREGGLAIKAKQCMGQETATLYKYILSVNCREEKNLCYIADSAGIGRNAFTDWKSLSRDWVDIACIGGL